MRPETAAALYDMDVAAGRIAEAAAGKSLEEYGSDWYFQSAIERQFGILGEALVRIRGLDPRLYERIPEAAKIVGLRNVLIHGYDTIDPKIVWSILEERLPELREVLAELLDEAHRQGL